MYVYLEVPVMNFCSAAAILCFVFELCLTFFQYIKAAMADLNCHSYISNPYNVVKFQKYLNVY